MVRSKTTPKKEIFHFQLLSVTHERLCNLVASHIASLMADEIKNVELKRKKLDPELEALKRCNVVRDKQFAHKVSKRMDPAKSCTTRRNIQSTGHTSSVQVHLSQSSKSWSLPTLLLVFLQ